MSGALIPAIAAVAIAAMVCLTATRAWRGWLELKRTELSRRPERGDVALRIELAALRERVKQLEAIADGVEL